MTDLERVFALTGQILANVVARRSSGRTLLERDRLLWSLAEAERRLYFAWAAQGRPS
jgi:hypothetical protein